MSALAPSQSAMSFPKEKLARVKMGRAQF